MIYDTLGNAATYYPLGHRFKLGFNYLSQFDPKTADGRVPIDGENVFAMVQSYVPEPAAQRSFEAHKVFADLQFVAEGEEVIFHSPLASLRETTPYLESGDAALYAGDDDFPILMRPGCFAIFYPCDGHKPGCVWRSSNRVKKVVIKIRL
jgi:YhcH/YjgK/YiaL family protein